MMSPLSGAMRPITRRAIVDLPHPDSPTIPSTSRFLTLKLTPSTARTTPARARNPPRTGKCLLSPRTSSKACSGPPTSAAGASDSSADIHCAPHSVAQQIEADRHAENHDPGERRHPGIDVNRGAQRVEHQAPFGLRRLRAKPKERKPRAQDHADTDQARGIDEDRPKYIAQDVHPHDGHGTGAGGARGVDKVEVACTGGHALGNPHNRRDEHDGERQQAVENAGTERARNSDCEQDGGKRVEDVDSAHDRLVDPTTGITSDTAPRRPD